MLIETLESRGITLNLDSSGNLKVGSPDPLTDEQRGYLIQHKVALIAELESGPAEDLHEAREECAGVLEYDGGLSRPEAETKAKQQIKHVRCLDCTFDKPDGPRCSACMVRSHRDLKIRLCVYFTANPQSLAPKNEKAIRLWLAFIGEENPDEISKVLAKAQADPKALAYYLTQAGGNSHE